jgi:hypothetical protein
MEAGMKTSTICARPGCGAALTIVQLARGGRYCSRGCYRPDPSQRAAARLVGVSAPTWRKAMRAGRAGWCDGRPWYEPLHRPSVPESAPCARPGCPNTLGPVRIKAGVQHCSKRCARLAHAAAVQRYAALYGVSWAEALAAYRQSRADVLRLCAELEEPRQEVMP